MGDSAESNSSGSEGTVSTMTDLPVQHGHSVPVPDKLPEKIVVNGWELVVND